MALATLPPTGAHNVLGGEGIPPLELLAAGRQGAEAHSVEVRDDTVLTVARSGDGFDLRLHAGEARGRRGGVGRRQRA